MTLIIMPFWRKNGRCVNIHDLEEIIWVHTIRGKGKAYILNRIPKPLASVFDRLLDTTSAQTVLLRMYTPGVVTALLLVLSFTRYALYRVVTSSLVTINDVLIGHAIGRKVE